MEQNKKSVRCIVCPLGCVAEVALEGREVVAIKNLACERGQTYAREEVTAPKRMLTTTVRVLGGELPLLPVVSQGVLPKEAIKPCARYLANVVVRAPIREGDIICKNIMGLGIDIVASRSLASSEIVTLH